MPLNNVENTISGKEGIATAVIDGSVYELFDCKTAEATLEYIKGVIKGMGRRFEGHKVNGVRGSGTLELHYMRKIFREQAASYVKTGKALYFDLQMVNADPASAAGKQTVLLKRCNLNSIILGKLDAVADDALSESLPFTFEGLEYLDHFTEISN